MKKEAVEHSWLDRGTGGGGGGDACADQLMRASLAEDTNR